MNTLKNTQFEACTKCTICTEYCPVSEVNANFPGPKQSGPDGERLRLKDAAFYDEGLKHCTNCKRCEVVCPSGVAVGDVIQLARKRFAKPNRSIRDALLSHTDLLGGLASGTLAPVANAVSGFGPVKKLLEMSLGIPASRVLPQYADTTFRHWFRENAADKQDAYPDTVVFFHGCYINYNNPSLGRDVVAVLNALDVGVKLLPRERCCGVPLIAGGFFKDATRNAEANTKSIQKMTEKGFKVLIASSTCAMTIRDEYPHILGIENAGWRNEVDLVTRYLNRLLETGKKLNFKPLPLKIAYHTACHMERLGWSAYSIELLRMIPGVDLRILPSQCCGIAGTYGFKRENYETSQKIGSRLFSEIEDSDVDLIVTECETCKMQIEMSTSKPCEHPVTIVARALAPGEHSQLTDILP